MSEEVILDLAAFRRLDHAEISPHLGPEDIRPVYDEWRQALAGLTEEQLMVLDAEYGCDMDSVAAILIRRALLNKVRIGLGIEIVKAGYSGDVDGMGGLQMGQRDMIEEREALGLRINGALLGMTEEQLSVLDAELSVKSDDELFLAYVEEVMACSIINGMAPDVFEGAMLPAYRALVMEYLSFNHPEQDIAQSEMPVDWGQLAEGSIGLYEGTSEGWDAYVQVLRSRLVEGGFYDEELGPSGFLLNLYNDLVRMFLPDRVGELCIDEDDYWEPEEGDDEDPGEPYIFRFRSDVF